MIVKSLTPKYKVLMQNRPKKLWIGGDMVQLEKTQDALTLKGHDVWFEDRTDNEIDADIVHLFNFSMRWTYQQYLNAKKQNKKIVCSMIYHATDRFVGWLEQQQMLNGMDALIFQTEGEMERVQKNCNLDLDKCWVIPNGIDKWWFDPIKTVKQEIVLTVGRIEPFKNQLTLAKVCKEMKVPLICVGEVTDASYAKNIIAQGGIILPPMTHEELKPLYAICKIFAIISDNETWSLVADEAGSQSANIIMTEGCERKDIPNVFKVPPHDELQIRFAIQKAMELQPNDTFRERLRANTWDKVATKIERVYENISSC